jgi:hypothetical protein
MRVTVVVDQAGKVVASTQVHRSDYPATIAAGAESDVPMAIPTLIANPGQTIHELTVPDNLAKLDAVEFHARLADYVRS